jgi:hypothetical protein
MSSRVVIFPLLLSITSLDLFVIGALVPYTPFLWPINAPWRAAANQQSLGVELVVLWS